MGESKDGNASDVGYRGDGNLSKVSFKVSVDL